MKIKELSASRGKTFMTCPHKYYIAYEMGIKAEAIHLEFGTLIHKVLERWFQEETPILDIYEEEWKLGTVTNFQYYTDGKNMLIDFESKHNKDKIRVIETEHEFNIELQPEKIDKDCPKCGGTGRLENDEPCTCYSPAVVIRGFIDRVDELDRKTIRVTDYKTSRVALTQAEAEVDFQLDMYFMAMSILYPEYENIELCLYYLREGVPVVVKKSKDFLEQFRPYVCDLFYQIWSAQDHTPKINNYCGWCDGKDHCEAYQNVLQSFPVYDKDPAQMDFADLFAEKEHIDNCLKILETRKKEIDTFFREEMKTRNADTLSVGEKELYYTSGRRMNYKLDTIKQVLPDNWEECLSIRKTVVDQLVGKDPQKKSILENHAEYYFVSPSLRARKIKAKKE